MLIAHLAAKVFCKILADDEDYFAESGTAGVFYRVIDHGLSGRPHGVELFETAVAGAHASGE